MTSFDPSLDKSQPNQLQILHSLEQSNYIPALQINAELPPEADSKPKVPEFLKDEDPQDPQDKDKARDKKEAPDKKKKNSIYSHTSFKDSQRRT